MKALTLHHGPLSFSALEAGSGPLVLLLHGFPDHARTFQHQLPAFAAAGFRAVAPTMRGYEPSSQPADADYSMSRIAEDVVAFIDELGGGPAHVVGHDWGAVVAYHVAAMAPARLASLTTLAVAHPRRVMRELVWRRPSQLLKSWYMAFFQLRGLADIAVGAWNFALIDLLWRRWSPDFVVDTDDRAALKDTLRAPGVKRAALAYYRMALNPMSHGFHETARLLARPIQVRTLALTGARDGCMDTRLHDDMMRAVDFPAGLDVGRVEGAGHFLHLEKPDEVTARLLAWFVRASEGSAATGG